MGPGARAAPDALNSVADSAAEAQEVPAESQTSYAQALPVDQQQQAQLGQYQPRQGRRQQKKQQQRQQQQHRRPKQQQQFAKQQQQRFFQQQNGQFVRHQ